MPLTPPDYYDLPSGATHECRQLPALNLGDCQHSASTYQFANSEGPAPLSQYSQCIGTSIPHPVCPPEGIRHAHSNYHIPSQGYQSVYGITNAPVLPPIRVSERIADDYPHHIQSKRAQSGSEPKEEKPMGGVAAHLDYEMDEMVNFVSETAHGLYESYASTICLADIDVSRSIVNSKSSVSSGLRKYVSQVLSSTRLPSSTILLGLHYLTNRMTLLSTGGVFNYGNGRVHRMLIIALLLGSKFLDDNTFQNQSWSEVSSIPVNDLNRDEAEWLAAMDWKMHIDPQDPGGLLLWQRQWQRYHLTKANHIEPLVRSFKQTGFEGECMQQPIQAHQYRSPNDCFRSAYSDNGTNRVTLDNVHSHWAAPRYDPWPPLRTQIEYSPPSAPETGPNTPEWYTTRNGFLYGRPPQQTYPSLKLPPPVQAASCNAPQSGYHTPYAQQYNPYGHGSTCLCAYCRSQHDHPLLAPGFAPQSVIG